MRLAGATRHVEVANLTVNLIDPKSGGALVLSDANAGGYAEIGGIPRICDKSNYTDNFGLQWNRFAAIQIDRQEGSQQSATRFFTETGWAPQDLNGQDVLEVGSGAGRFSRVVLERTTARLWSVDYSTAVDANLRNNGAIGGDRFKLFQASIYEMPFADGSFDKTFCLGVLQHTPDFEASVRALIAKTRPGGEIVVDFYPIRGFWTKIHAKYLLRPITRRMAHAKLLGLIERHVDKLIATSRWLDRCGLHVLNRFVPVCDIRGTLPRELSPEELREWVVLDTFDAFSPEYDNPQRVSAVADMFRRNGASVDFAGFVDNGPNSQAAVVRGTRLA